MKRPLRILTVCTGNICRSPMAQASLSSEFESSGVPAVIESAGTAALVGEPRPGPATDVLSELGITPTPHSARQLDASMLLEADLVLAMSREHRAAVVRTLPRAVRSTFTIVEFARLAELVTVEDIAEISEGSDPLRDAIALPTRHRGEALLAGDSIDIVDPYRRRMDVFREVGNDVQAASSTIGRYFARIATAECPSTV